MELFRSRRFALLFAGTALNAIGTWATLIALWGYAAYRFDATAGQIGLLGLAWALPAAVLSPVAGLPIDRFGPKSVLIASDLLGAATSLAMAMSGSFSALVGLALVHGLVQAFGRPAANTLAPRLVDDADLLAANSLLRAAQDSSLIFGPLVGSAAIALWSLRGAFVIDAASFLVGAATVSVLVLSPPPARVRQSGLRELAQGFRLARTLPTIRFTLVLAAATYFSWGAFFVIEPLYVRDVLHRSPAVLGLLQTACGVGLVITAVAVARLGHRVTTRSALASSVLLSGVAAAIYVGTHWMVIAFAGVFLWGVDMAFFNAPMQTLLQRGSPADAHGRILSIANTLNGAGHVIAVPMAGLAVGSLGVRTTGMAVGGLLVAAGVAGLHAARRPRTADLGPDDADIRRRLSPVA